MRITKILPVMILALGMCLTSLWANHSSNFHLSRMMDCDITLDVDDATSSVSIGGLIEPHVKVKIYDENWALQYECFDNCGEPAVFSGLTPGNYNVTILMMDDGWSEICESTASFQIVEPPCIDNDGDGLCEFEDCDDNNADLPTLPDTTCDDGNPATSDDVILEDGCSCAGEFVAGPCDLSMVIGDNSVSFSNFTAAHNKVRVFDLNWNLVFECFDNCAEPTVVSSLLAGDYLVAVILFNENWENICESNVEISVAGVACDSDVDGDGVCTADDCDDNDASLPASPGTACDDGDAATVNDEIQADGCTCVGSPPGNACDFTYDVDGAAGSISIGNLTAPHVKVRVLDASWNELFECFDNCTEPQVIAGLVDGHYILNVIYMDETYQSICDNTIEFEISGVNCPVDADNDGFCSDVDCDDNNPNLPLPAGTACDDGDALTVNDEIQADGCICTGTPITETPCDDVNYFTNPNLIHISGLDAAHTIIKVYDNFFTELIYGCQDDDCMDPTVIVNIETGDYVLNIRFFDANWNLTCEVNEVINVPEPGFNEGVDNRNDFGFSQQGFKIFPNPVSEQLNIQFDEAMKGSTQVSIVNQLGALVLQEQFIDTGQMLSLNIDEIDRGMYHLVIENAMGDRVSQRFVKF